MAFKEDMQKLSLQVIERKQHITNEEMTKQALIIPFLQMLGFDIFNPLEVQPEYVADFGKKKGEKVDYALFKSDSPIIFLEAKSVAENLENHDAQLARYFNSVQDVRLGILSNGVIYKFFTDLDANNIMDNKPFLTIDITNLTDSDIENLTKFKKDSFDKEHLIEYSEELVYTSSLNENLKELFKNPNDDFVKFLIKDFKIPRITAPVIERFKPIVKKAISNAVLDIVSKGLYQQDVAAAKEIIEPVQSATQETTEELKEDKPKRQIVTTDEELAAFEDVKRVLEKENRDIQDIAYKDTLSYFSINHKNILGWFLRLSFDSQNKYIVSKIDVETAKSLLAGFKVEPAPKGMGESRIYLTSGKDLLFMKDFIIACFDKVITIA